MVCFVHSTPVTHGALGSIATAVGLVPSLHNTRNPGGLGGREFGNGLRNEHGTLREAQEKALSTTRPDAFGRIRGCTQCSVNSA